MKKSFLILFTLFLSLACDKVVLRPKEIQVGRPPLTLITDQFINDGKGGLFNNIKWYEYHFQTHLIWSLHDVYVINSGEKLYKLQILSYFGNGSDEAGTYKIRLASSGSEHTLLVDAIACGNPYTNPDHSACVADPHRNIYTYLNLDTLEARPMTEAQSLLDQDWHIAFRGTDVKLNSGTSGPGKTVGGLGRRFDFFFDQQGNVLVDQLRNNSLLTQAYEGFDQLSLDDTHLFYLPDGIDRVIHEGQWFSSMPDTTRVANDQNWWILREHTGLSYNKMNIASIDDHFIDNQYTTQIELHYYRQGEEDEVFSDDLQSILIEFDSTKRTQTLCVKFETQEIYPCERDRLDWDLRLVLVHLLRNGVWNREWRIFTQQGAIGPLSKERVDGIDSARVL